MNKFFLNVLATVTAAALIANVAVLFKLNERITRIETILKVQNQTVSKI